MQIYTDSIESARNYFPEIEDWNNAKHSDFSSDINQLSQSIFKSRKIFSADIPDETANFNYDKLWHHVFVVEHAKESHYDILTSLCRQNIPIPDGIICLADYGDKFHGFKNRHWVALRGNLHLVAFLRPEKEIKNYGAGFMIMAAVSALDTADSIIDEKYKAAIKWVNDIVIERAKVCGVLAYSQSDSNIVTGAVIGIGMNVSATPKKEVSKFIPKTACLADFIEDSSIVDSGKCWQILQSKLAQNYRHLLNGNYKLLLDIYRNRSAVIGRTVEIYEDQAEMNSKPITSGRAAEIGVDLELILENNPKPITGGRLIIKDK
jgi:BirA family biotin operon repressor/biotin-[acetyl-CoA-carboxylase] ligase